MTVQELSRLYWLRREIQADRDRLEKLTQEIEYDEAKLAAIEAQAVSLSAQAFDDTPVMGSKIGSRVENDAIVLADLKRHIEEKKRLAEALAQTIREKILESTAEQARLEGYIAAIPPGAVRSIMTYRFVEGLTWEQVSDALGFRSTPDSVKKLCYRYLKAENGTDA